MTTVQDETKSKEYWLKRRKNNEAARRSREKRRMNDLLLERRVMRLSEENKNLRSQLLSMKIKYGETEEIKSPSVEERDDFTSISSEFSLNSSIRNISGSLGFKGCESKKRKLSHQFTQRVITNATGDTSATVLVNHAGSSQNSKSLLSSLHLENDLARIMPNPQNQSTVIIPDFSHWLERNYDSFGTELRNNDSPASSSFENFSSFKTQVSSNLEQDLFQVKPEVSYSPPQSFCTSNSSCPSDATFGTQSLSRNAAFMPNMLETLRNHLEKGDAYEPSFAPSQQHVLAEEILYQMQVYLDKLEGMDHINNIPIHLIEDKHFSVNGLSDNNIKTPQPRLSPGKFWNRITPRHRSCDSGFDGNDENIKRSTHPLSPPPSPDSTNRVYSKQRFIRGEDKEPQSKKNQLNDFMISKNDLKWSSADKALISFTEKTFSGISKSASSEPQCGIHRHSLKKTDFQLPHKLRLKKSSVTSEYYPFHCDKEVTLPLDEAESLTDENGRQLLRECRNGDGRESVISHDTLTNTRSQRYPGKSL
ncbi:uncharacterized protein LOC143459082 isoform X2 [Clavelina lepadiformis]|uniref:BZIP domain-containing protein n=1 Tax=Clavelina lepadiformis TaxID=159417 RepID=A0ABP0FCX5_CLALP